VTSGLEPPDWVSAAFGPGLTALERLPWGFTNETWAGTASDGVRYVATRMAVQESAAGIVERGPLLAQRLAAAGIATSTPIPARSQVALGVIVSTWLDGRPGMTRMDGSAGAQLVGAALGEADARLRHVDPSGLRLGDLWTRPPDLVAAALGWLARVGTELDATTSVAVRRHIERLPGLLRDRATGFVHGDLVPANILLRDAEPPAILDLEAATLGDPLFDAAWCSWIVRYHHPDLHGPLWSAFAAAAGLADRNATEAALLESLPLLRILELLDAPRLSSDARRRWLRQLEAAARSG
jgi:Ser/Thr protein kinase RdoA (MazF antagonist)